VPEDDQLDSKIRVSTGWVLCCKGRPQIGQFGNAAADGVPMQGAGELFTNFK
jgi:hypothetical protein